VVQDSTLKKINDITSSFSQSSFTKMKIECPNKNICHSKSTQKTLNFIQAIVVITARVIACDEFCKLSYELRVR